MAREFAIPRSCFSTSIGSRVVLVVSPKVSVTPEQEQRGQNHRDIDAAHEDRRRQKPQLGTRRPDGMRLLLPVVITAGIGFKHLKALPAGSTAHLLELAGLAAGLLFGLASVALVKVRRDSGDGRLVTVAGWPYAAVWTLALALRLGFAYGSAHWFTGTIASFSAAHRLPPATYGTAFVIMVLTMITVRTIGAIARGRAVGASISFSFQNLRIARRLAASHRLPQGPSPASPVTGPSPRQDGREHPRSRARHPRNSGMGCAAKPRDRSG